MDENGIIGFLRGVGGLLTNVLEWLASMPDFLCGLLFVGGIAGALTLKVVTMVLDKFRS